jgi:hypothetical protein
MYEVRRLGEVGGDLRKLLTDQDEDWTGKGDRCGDDERSPFDTRSSDTLVSGGLAKAWKSILRWMVGFTYLFQTSSGIVAPVHIRLAKWSFILRAWSDLQVGSAAFVISLITDSL